MTPGVIVDAGPLAAFYLPRERHHDWVVDRFKELDVQLVTCEPVVAETCFLLARWKVPAQAVLSKIEDGAIAVDFALADEVAAVTELMNRYADQPMSLADACLVRMAELTNLPICTIDSDFRVYRKNRRQRIPLIAP